MILTAPANTLMEIPYNRPIFFYLCISSTSRDVLENIPSNCLGANSNIIIDYSLGRNVNRPYLGTSRVT